MSNLPASTLSRTRPAATEDVGTWGTITIENTVAAFTAIPTTKLYHSCVDKPVLPEDLIRYARRDGSKGVSGADAHLVNDEQTKERRIPMTDVKGDCEHELALLHRDQRLAR